jgi:hypothetical protein
MKKNRLNRIKELSLESCNNNINNNIINKLFIKYKNELDGYDFVENNDSLKEGNFLKYISLDLNKIIYGIIVKLEKYTCNTGINIIMLKHNKNIWKIKPCKYYIFQKKNNNRSQLSKILDKYLNNIK